MFEMPARELPEVEPTDADLIDILTLPWEESQGYLERLLYAAGRIEQHQAAVAGVRTLPTPAGDEELGVAA